MKTKIISVIVLLITVTMAAQIDRSVQPKPGPAPEINLGTPKTFNLKNGLQVLVVENHKLPRVSATLTIDNTPKSYGAKKGVEDLMGGMLGTGSESMPKANFDEEIDYLGANISFWDEGASARSLSRYFPKVLNLMADAIINPVFDQEEFDKQMKQNIDAIKSNGKSVKAISRRVENLLTYGKEHPFGEFTSEETLKNVSLNDVKNLYKNYFKPNNAYLIIIGDVNFKTVKKLVTKAFKPWKKGEVSNNSIPEVKNVATTEINFINMPNAVQSEVSVINSVKLQKSDSDYYAVLLANKILGGGATERLFMNLREDKGYTYGAYSSIGASRYASRFRASAAVRNTVTDSSVVEIMKEINRIRTENVTAEELKNAKASYIGSFVMAVEKPSTIASYALDIAMLNLPETFYANYLKNINAVTIEDVQKAAKKHISADNARIVITGKAIDMVPALEKLNYKINYFDKEGNSTEKPELTKPIPADVTKQTVIDHYLNAIGGAEKIKAFESTLVTYEASAMGNTVSTTEKRTASKYVNETSMGGAVIMKIIMTDAGVFMNKQPLPEKMANEMKYTLGTFIEIGLLHNENSKLTSIESIDGKDAYVITTKGEIVSSSIYFDAETGLKIKEVQTINMGGKTQNQEATFSNYKEFNGIKFPGTKTGSLGPQTVEFKLVDAKVNEGVSNSDFE